MTTHPHSRPQSSTSTGALALPPTLPTAAEVIVVTQALACSQRRCIELLCCYATQNVPSKESQTLNFPTPRRRAQGTIYPSKGAAKQFLSSDSPVTLALEATSGRTTGQLELPVGPRQLTRKLDSYL